MRSPRIWRVFPTLQALVDQAKADTPRCLTPAERREFFLDKDAPDWCHEMSKWPYKPRRWGVIYENPAGRRAERLGLAGQKGVLVTRVVKGLPAEAAGFEPDDLIMSIAAEPVRSEEEAAKAFDKVPANAQIAVAVRRKGEVKVLTMTPKY